MTGFLFAMGLIDLALLLFLARQWGNLNKVGRTALGGVAFAALPTVVALAVVMHGLNDMKSVTFCGSCHAMETYVASLHVDDEESIPAIHYQNNWVPQDTGCYDCHSEYGMFGDIKAKINGLKHVYVNYVTGPPETIELYQPYQNRDCLHCHEPSKRFQENEDHVDNMEDMRTMETTCQDCHDVGHVLD